LKLIADLELDSAPAEGVADLHLLAGALRRPRRLRQLLRDRRYDALAVRTGELPLSGLQALVQLSLIIARTGVWQVEQRRLTRGRFAAHAIRQAIIAVAREAGLSAVTAGRLLGAARRPYRLPSPQGPPRRALYIRAEPSLRWQRRQVGGAATHTEGVINGLIDNGVDVHVVAAERPAGTERADFTAVPPRRVLQLIRGLAYTDYAAELVRGATGLSADFVYLRYQYGSYAGLEVARRLRVPLVLEFNGPEIWVERHWRSGRLLLEQPLAQLEQRHLHDATLVVVVSSPLRDHVLAQGVDPRRVLVNPNGVDLEQLRPYRERRAAEWRRQLGLVEAPTVGFIGTFGPWHGVQLLPDLVAAVPEARWVLIGGGGLFDRVRTEVRARGLENRVLLTGILERDVALRLLACSDVCISPHVPNPDGTPFFGSPTKLFEYMGLRRAIVASNLDQIGEVLEHGRSGLLVPPGDVDAAAAAVRRVLTDEPLRERLAAGALARAREYSWQAHSRRILAALHVLATGSPAEDVASVGAR